jgi:hypothetical protein
MSACRQQPRGLVGDRDDVRPRSRALDALAEEIHLMLAEGVAADVRDIDLAMLLEAGWPFHLGGAITPYLDRAGARGGLSRQARIRTRASEGPREAAGLALMVVSRVNAAQPVNPHRAAVHRFCRGGSVAADSARSRGTSPSGKGPSGWDR